MKYLNSLLQIQAMENRSERQVKNSRWKVKMLLIHLMVGKVMTTLLLL